jgi:hypothetical protein
VTGDLIEAAKLEATMGPSSADSPLAEQIRSTAAAVLGKPIDEVAWRDFFRCAAKARMKFMHRSQTPAAARARLERLASAAAEFSAAINAMRFGRETLQRIDAEACFPEAIETWIFEQEEWDFHSPKDVLERARCLASSIGDIAANQLASSPAFGRGEGKTTVGYADFSAAVNALWFLHRSDKGLSKRLGRSTGKRAELGLALEALLPSTMRRGSIEKVGDALASCQKK